MSQPESWQQALIDEPSLFIAHYFGHRLKHRLEHFHLTLIDTATTKVRGLVLYPAAHGKTTLVSTLLPIWAVCKDPDVRIAIITKNQQDAKNIMRAIQAELLGNEKLIADFGPFYNEENFSLDSLSVAKRTIRSKEPTIAAFGAGSRLAIGHRSDWVICDDIVTDANSGSIPRREDLREWFNLGPEAMGEDPDDRLTVVGTMFDPEDLYHDLTELADPDDGLQLWHVDKFDAIVDEETHETLWPIRWPYKRLMMQKAKMGTLDFNKRYRNIAVDASRMVFREEYVKGGYIGKQKYPGCVDKNFRVGEREDDWRIYCGFDPAVGVGRSAKFCAHVTLAVGRCSEHERCYYVVDLIREQLTLPQQVATIISQHEKHGAMTSMVEANSYQQGLFQAIQQKMVEQGLAYRIEPHYTNRTNKPDPELGVQAMSPIFENGLVHIPAGNPESQRKMQILVDELIMYPGRTTDTVMAFWFAWKNAQETAPKFKSFTTLKKPLFAAGYRPRRVLTNPYYA